MNENKFWTIIEHSHSASNQYKFLIESLSELPPNDIISFQVILRAKMAEAYVSDMISANFLIRSYVSDDEFEEFRAWLVFNGRDRFTNAITNVETIADWLNPEKTDNINGEVFLLIAQEAYKNYGDEETFLDELYQRPDFVFDPEIEQEWPNSKAELRQKFPRLFDLFWNPNKIKESYPNDLNEL